MTVRHETFEHEADIGVRGLGGSVEEAFAGAAAALYSVMVDLSQVETRIEKQVIAEAGDREQLLVEWLNALLAISDIERMVFSRFAVRIEGVRLEGSAWGEPLDQVKHRPNVEVKGATYHMLSVHEREGEVIAQCVVDV